MIVNFFRYKFCPKRNTEKSNCDENVNRNELIKFLINDWVNCYYSERRDHMTENNKHLHFSDWRLGFISMPDFDMILFKFPRSALIPQNC